MKKKLLALVAIAAVLAVAIYFALPGLLVKYGRYADRKASRLQEKSIRLGDHEIAYLEGGQGEAILMVHGFAANKDNWTRFAKFFTPKYRVVALDLPGFGQSTYRDDASYRIEEQAKRLDQFATAVGLQKFHIVGSSMGGQIAGLYAVMFPDKVLTLGLFAASGVKPPVPSELAQIIAKGEPNPLVVGSAEEFDRLMKFVFVTPPDVPAIVKSALVSEAMAHKTSNQKIAGQLADGIFALESDLPKIKVPTLVLWGDRDRLLEVSSVPVFAKGLPRCRTAIMKECGHLPMIERPQEAAEIYMAFLKDK